MTYNANTFLAYVDPINPDPQTMALAAQAIQTGGLVAFPTETVYGLGANAHSQQAVSQIFAAKQRPSNDPLIVHIADLDQLSQVALVNDERVWELVERFWAGALTLILPKQNSIPDNVTANQNTVAVRMPNNLIAQTLIRLAGLPIAAPSANRFSRPSPTTAQHVWHDLNGHVDIILDGGSTQIGVESTILDLTQPIPTVLRAGGVTLEALRELLPNVVVRQLYLKEGENAPASGTLLKHYSPNAEVWLFRGGNTALVHERMRQTAESYLAEGKRVGILLPDDELGVFTGLRVQVMLMGETNAQLARHLFNALRTLESAGVDIMLVQGLDEAGLGLAVLDRLYRAAEGRVIEVKG